MKNLKFKTTRNRTFDIHFDENEFLNWMEVYGTSNLGIENQICQYLNYKYREILDWDKELNKLNEWIGSIDYSVSQLFRTRYDMIDATLKYNL